MEERGDDLPEKVHTEGGVQNYGLLWSRSVVVRGHLDNSLERGLIYAHYSLLVDVDDGDPVLNLSREEVMANHVFEDEGGASDHCIS